MNASMLTITEFNDYLNKIFDLEFQVLKKDLKIDFLQIEISILKQILESYKKYPLKGELE